MLPPRWMWPHLAAALLAKFLERCFLDRLVGLEHSQRVDWAEQHLACSSWPSSLAASRMDVVGATVTVLIVSKPAQLQLFAERRDLSFRLRLGWVP